MNDSRMYDPYGHRGRTGDRRPPSQSAPAVTDDPHARSSQQPPMMPPMTPTSQGPQDQHGGEGSTGGDSARDPAARAQRFGEVAQTLSAALAWETLTVEPDAAAEPEGGATTEAASDEAAPAAAPPAAPPAGGRGAAGGAP